MACTKTGSKNDLFLNCRRKPKELSKKELSNVAPASMPSAQIKRSKICLLALENTDVHAGLVYKKAIERRTILYYT